MNGRIKLLKFKETNFLKRMTNAIKDTENLKTPMVFKEATEIKDVLMKLQEEITNSSDEKQKKSLQERIKLLDLGLTGENNVLFELKNSFLPLHILHDVRIVHNDFKAQLDFVIVTRKFLLVIEVKNYYGNILINDKDEFIRQVYKGNKLVFQEGFYSPVRQVERQVKIFESYLRDMGAITKTPIKSVVVFTNNKTIINTKNASKEVKNKILRSDHLVDFIKKELEKSSPVYFLDNRMKELSDYILSSHLEFLEEEIDKIELKLLTDTINNDKELIESEPITTVIKTDAGLEQELKALRLKFASEQNVKAFHIFTNKTLDDLLVKRPCSLDELKTIYGLGEVKINSFGKELIDIIKKYS